jgi:putative SOS response-associated peptidase YedK
VPRLRAGPWCLAGQRASRSDRSGINARSDKVLASKLWRSLAATPEGRVLIPADGWYEWMHAERQRNGPKPAPFHHQIDDGGWFAFAGLRSRARVEDVEGPLVTVAIITTDAAGPAARCVTECRLFSPIPKRRRRGSRPSYS